MRHFKKMLFMGMGKESKESIQFLRKRLKEAVVIQSGLQQGVPTTSSEYKEGMTELEDIVKDIGMAILGKEIRIPKDCACGNPLNHYEMCSICDNDE